MSINYRSGRASRGRDSWAGKRPLGSYTSRSYRLRSFVSCFHPSLSKHFSREAFPFFFFSFLSTASRIDESTIEGERFDRRAGFIDRVSRGLLAASIFDFSPDTGLRRWIGRVANTSFLTSSAGMTCHARREHSLSQCCDILSV